MEYWTVKLNPEYPVPEVVKPKDCEFPEGSVTLSTIIVPVHLFTKAQLTSDYLCQSNTLVESLIIHGEDTLTNSHPLNPISTIVYVVFPLLAPNAKLVVASPLLIPFTLVNPERLNVQSEGFAPFSVDLIGVKEPRITICLGFIGISLLPAPPHAPVTNL